MRRCFENSGNDQSSAVAGRTTIRGTTIQVAWIAEVCGLKEKEASHDTNHRSGRVCLSTIITQATLKVHRMLEAKERTKEIAWNELFIEV
jgi:hypothetical protein